MSHPHSGSLATYNSLTDKHLAGYFSNTRIRRHLQQSGLISRSGRIISEKEYRLNAMRKDHQRYVRECLAQAIFHKVLDMERHHQLEIKRQLENVVRREHVQRLKVERSRRSVEDINPLLSPRPPAGPRSRYGHRVLADGEQSGPSQASSSPRPNTAPGNMQRPVRLQPLPGYPTAGSTPKTSSRSKQKFLELEHDHQFSSEGDKSMLRLMNSVDYSAGLSPYQLPIINNYVIPVPPPPQKGDKNLKGVRHGTSRGRRFRPTTAPDGLEQLLTKDSGKFHKPSLHSNASVTMIYLGKSVHLSHDDTDYRDEIKVYQQHCGEKTFVSTKASYWKETFHFTSKRHHGFPFSLTFFLNGLQVDRLSSCCEYKHRKGTRLGGKNGYFGFANVDKASPCYRCIIAMGLDKNPLPPKKKMKADYGEKQEDSVKDEEHCEPSEGSVKQEMSKNSSAEISSPGKGQEPAEDNVEIGEEEREEETQEGPESEDDQENASKDEYDEDFEADEEKSDEKVNEERQADDQMNGMSKSPSDDEKDNLDHEKESKSSSQKTPQASDSEKDESDGYSNSDSEEDKQDRKSASSLSSSRTLYSSEDDSETEKMKDHVKGNEKKDTERIITHEKHGNETWESNLLKSVENQEIDAVEEEVIDEAEETKAEAVMRKDVEFLPGSMMEIHCPGNDELNGEPNRVGSIANNTREEGEEDGSNAREDGEEVVLEHLEGSTVEAEATNKDSPEVDEGGDCKSVQEKIAEAIENDHHLSSEPEPSDSSTDEDEENLTSTAHDIKEDGAFLAEAGENEKAAEQVVQEVQMVDEQKTLEKEEESVAQEGATDTEEGGNETGLETDLLAKEEAGAVMGQTVGNVLTVKEEASEEQQIMEEDLERSRVGKEMTFEGEGMMQEEVNEDEGAVGKAAYEEKVVEKVLFEGEEVPEGEEIMKEAASDAEEAVGMAEDLGKAASEAEEALEAAGFEGKESVEDSVAEGIVLEREEVVEEAASEGGEAIGEAEFALEESVKVPILGAATEIEESVESREVLIGKAVSEVEEAATEEQSEEEKEDVMEATPEEKETRNETTEEESEVEESALPTEETSLDREIKMDIAIAEGAHKDGDSLAEASEEEAAAIDPETEEEVVDEGIHRGELLAEEIAYMAEELMKTGEEKVTEEAEENKLLIGKKVPIDEAAIDEPTINEEAVAEGAEMEELEVTEGMAMEEVEMAEGATMEKVVTEESGEKEGEGISEIPASEEAKSEDIGGKGKVMGTETPSQEEELVEKSESGEKGSAAVLLDWKVQTEDAGHEEGQEEEEAGSEKKKAMTEEIIPNDNMGLERTLPEVENLMIPASLLDEVEAVEASPEVEGMTQEMAYHRGVMEKDAVLVEEEMAKMRRTDGNDKTEEGESETTEEKTTLKQLDKSEKIKIGKTEALAEYPQGSHGSTDLLEIEQREESLTDTTGASITEERN